MSSQIIKLPMPAVFAISRSANLRWGAKEAFDSLMAATSMMDMGDSLGDTKITFYDEITERVSS